MNSKLFMDREKAKRLTERLPALLYELDDELSSFLRDLNYFMYYVNAASRERRDIVVKHLNARTKLTKSEEEKWDEFDVDEIFLSQNLVKTADKIDKLKAQVLEIDKSGESLLTLGKKLDEFEKESKELREFLEENREEDLEKK